MVAALPWWRPADPLTGRVGLLSYAPSALATELSGRIQPGTRVFAPQVWTSWFEWAVPDATYFVDSRFELFPADVWADLDTVSGGGPAAAGVLERWNVGLLVLGAGDAVPAGWMLVHEDVDGSIAVPKGGGAP